MLNNVKSQKGITGIDISISILIIMLFISIISGLIISVSTSITSKKCLEIATNCMTEIMEKIDEIDYGEIDISDNENENIIDNIKDISVPDGLGLKIQTILQNSNKPEYKILKVGIQKERYTKKGEEDKDLLKKITVKISYELNGNIETLEVTRLKPKYNVEFE